MKFANFLQLVSEWKLWSRAMNNTIVRCGSLRESNRYFKFLIFSMTLRVLHLFQNDAFLHLSNILFFNHSHEMLEGVINFIGVEFVTLSNAFA